ncbi:MAG: BatD family protein [Chloroflexota bacterium]
MAQSTPVQIEVTRRTFALGESLQLSISVSGSGAQEPELTSLDGLENRGASTSNEVSIINGAVSSKTTYKYTLVAMREGNLTIGPIRITVDGQTYQSEPITIQATPPAQGSGGQNGQGQDLFIEAVVSNETPYLGEQIQYQFRVYIADGVSLRSQPNYVEPTFDGFWRQQSATANPGQSQAQSQPTERVEYTTERDGRRYRVTEFRSILFPTVAGERVITPAKLVFPNTLFNAGQTFQTDPLVIQVRPHPEPIPAEFTGAVGQLVMQAELQIDPNEDIVKANEPVTLRITIEGAGNAESWPDPMLPAFDNWRFFESTSSTNSQLQDGRLVGRRTYEQLIVPTISGDFTIDALTYIYFDPTAEAYKTATTEPLSLTVAPDERATPPPVIPLVTQEDVLRLDTDIRHIKPAPATLRMAQPLLTSSTLYWLLWAVPVLLLVADYGRVLLRRRNPEKITQNRAKKQALQLLTNAEKSLKKQGDVDAYAVVNQALTGYLSDLLAQPVAGLTLTALAERLQMHGFDEETVAQIGDLLNRSEMGRYAPGATGDGGDLLDEAKSLLSMM